MTEVRLRRDAAETVHPDQRESMIAMALVAPEWIEAVSVPIPTPQAGEVLVRVEAVGICGSDLAVYHGTMPPPAYPWIMGHEGGGTVVAVGPGVPRERLGERVVIEPNYYESDADGTSRWCSVGVNVPGMLAEYVAVPADHAWVIDAHTSPQSLVSFEPLAVAEAARRRSRIEPGAEALVIGAGSTGVAMIALLLVHGVAVSFIDPHPGRSARAQRVGATPLNDERRFAYVFETAGAPTTWTSALAHVGDGGMVVVTGLSNSPQEFVPADLVRHQLTLLGSLTYEHPLDFSAVLSGAAVDDGELAPYRYDFHATNDAFSRARSLDGKSWVSVS
jgi:alcohol dehydrogenase/L-iditol 2-dehydrogenase